MALEVNGGDYNMPTIAGKVSDMIFGHTMPLDLYVYGVGGREDSIFLDAQFPDAEMVCTFLQNQNVNIQVGLPTNPNIRPAVALSRQAREHENADRTAGVLAFLLFVLHETVLLSQDQLQDRYDDIGPQDEGDLL